MHNDTQILFQHSILMLTQVSLPTQTRRTMIKFTPTIPITLSFVSHPVTPIDPTTSFISLSISPLLPEPPEELMDFPTYLTLQKKFCASLLPWQTALFGTLWKAQSINTLYTLLKSSVQLMMVSNACIQKNSNSGFALVLANDHLTIWHGTGHAPSPEGDICSSRAEAYGLLVAITFVTYYISCYDNPVPLTSLTCYCDNIRMINTLISMQLSETIQPNDTTNNECDLYLEIIAQVAQCTSIEYQYLHVKGHQDKNLEHQLTIAEQHNVDCDHLAKQFVQMSPQTSTNLPHP